jgi:predicted ArsR family transcriptional regulator
VERDDLDRRLTRVAALGEPARRLLYQYVAGETEPVSRDQVTAATGVARHVAKFHLERLVDDGLLTFDYRRPPGRGGPGAGRPAKVYAIAGDLDVSVPERRYDLAGRLLVRAIGTAARTGTPMTEAVSEVARAAGRDLARDTPGSRRRKLRTVLEDCGFRPSSSGRDITLRNCPFHRLAEEDRDLVCTMNLAFVNGVLDGIAADGVTACLDPTPGACCVRITR